MPESAERQAAPARAFWSGTLTFGLVSIPVDLFAGVRGRRTSMKMVDAKGHPLGREYYSAEDDAALSPEDIVRGYETDDGKMVVVTDEELDAIAPGMSRDIELRRFVPREQIAPAYYQRPYFLLPSGRSAKAYQLLAQTMQNTGRVGIGTFVMRGHQYLAAILSDGNVLRAETLRFAAELRSPADLGLPERAKPAAKEVGRFAKAIASLRRDSLDKEELSDRYAEAIAELVQGKAKKGQGLIEAAAAADEDEEEGGGNVIDLMKLLKERVGRPAKGGAAKPAAPGSKADGGSARLQKLSRKALYERAQALDISGRSTMAKEALIAAIQKKAG